jgi:eukaryotic-like serine/threonine-protein kinase
VTLVAASRLGPYEIVAPLGAGGMGEVYRARDERIGRDVAIKVLPGEFASDPDRLRRFEQEARAAGQLNHPNILTVHDTGTHEGAPYIVTELLEGETLRERLRSGGLGVRKAVEIAIQIARGLAAAHEKGIIHRDLKPANVFVTKDGHVKILDFGVAKLIHPEVKVDPYAKTTTSGPTTEAGSVVGTAGYISPEQLRGFPADHRSDIFALGCVLYEMLSGKAPFLKDTGADIAAAILNEEPAPLTIPGREIPAALRAVVERCLEKSPEERFQSARDLAFGLETLSGTSGEAAAAARPGRIAARSRIRERLAWGVAAAIAVFAIGALLALNHMRRPPKADLVRFSVTGPEVGTLANDVAASAISPDGRRLVFSVIDAAGTIRLWVRSLDTLSAQALVGTEGATFPFWSPDSRLVAFFSQGKLRKVPVAGGSPEVICNAPDPRGGTWSTDGVIVFAPRAMGPLVKVSAEGGEPVEVGKPDATRGDAGLRFPYFLPDKRHFLYVSLPRKQSGFDVYVGALDSKESKRIGSALSAPIYAGPGYLLFVLGERLVAQRFDLSTLQTVGKAMPLADAPPGSTFDAGVALSASTNGVLAHAASSPALTELVWLDRAGRQTGRIALPPGSYSNPSFSPDGGLATVTKFNSAASYDLWLVDLQRSVTTRLTFDGLVAGGGMSMPVVWSPDGTRVAYGCAKSGLYDVYQVLASGSGRPEQLVHSDVQMKIAAAWSPDGKYFVFSGEGEGGQYDLWVQPLHEDRAPFPYLRTPFNEDACAISPDGRWLAYDSDETGAMEIYVRSFPEPGEKYRVSTSGGTIAQWSRDGKQLLYFSLSQYYSGSGPIYVVDVETKPTFKTGAPRLLFTPRPDISGLVATADLSRFLATVPAEGAPPASITVTLNWEAALER